MGGKILGYNTTHISDGLIYVVVPLIFVWLIYSQTYDVVCYMHGLFSYFSQNFPNGEIVNSLFFVIGINFGKTNLVET